MHLWANAFTVRVLCKAYSRISFLATSSSEGTFNVDDCNVKLLTTEQCLNEELFDVSVCVGVRFSLPLTFFLSLFLSLSIFLFLGLLCLSLPLSLFPFVRWPQKKIDRLDGLILIGRGLAKRLDLLREGGHFYAGAQCRGFLPCVKGMLMISKRLGDLDICVTERSAKMQVPMNTLKQDDGTAGSLPCVPAQNIDFKIAFEDDESTEMEVPLQKGHVAHDKLQLKWNGQSGSVFAYCGEDFTGPDSSLHRQVFRESKGSGRSLRRRGYPA
ncbi:unnamed protein product, partial [Symbiodinium microadriaticum]